MSDGFKEYLVTLTRGGRSYYVVASSPDGARLTALNFEPHYNEAWGVEVRAVIREHYAI